MKKIFNQLLLVGCLTSLIACEDKDYDIQTQIPERFHKILYLKVNGKQDLTLYNTGQDNVYSFSIVKAGSEDNLPASANIDVLTQAEVDNRYSSLEGVNYKVLDEQFYSIDLLKIDFSTEERYKMVNVSLDPRGVIDLMEEDPTASLVLPLMLSSESDSINANRKELFLQLKEVITPAIGFSNTDFYVNEYTYGRVPNIEVKAPFRLDVTNMWNIEGQFGVNEEYLADYNAANGTIFKMVPENLFSFAETFALPEGTTETELAVSVEGESLTPGDYMLPIQIKNISMFEISADRNTYPIAIRIMGSQFSRDGWTATATTEEPSGEGAGNGVANCMLDGKLNTYWHTQWQGAGANPPLPHTIIIDTKEEHTFTQFALTHRENVYYTRGGEFYVSSDLDNWGEKVGNFTLKQANGSQVFGINPATGRYIKIVVTESNRDNGLATIAEFYAYGIN